MVEPTPIFKNRIYRGDGLPAADIEQDPMAILAWSIYMGHRSLELPSSLDQHELRWLAAHLKHIASKLDGPPAPTVSITVPVFSRIVPAGRAEMRRLALIASESMSSGQMEMFAEELLNIVNSKGACMSEWQPINTAPIDKAILVWNGAFTIAHYNSAYNFWVGHGLGTEDTRSFDNFPPTHWVSLPEPPKE